MKKGMCGKANTRAWWWTTGTTIREKKKVKGKTNSS